MCIEYMGLYIYNGYNRAAEWFFKE